MARIVLLTSLVAFSILMTAWLPTAQSFNFGRIIISHPIVLRTPSSGPFEARPRIAPEGATSRARQLVSSALRRLTAPAARQQVAGAESSAFVVSHRSSGRPNAGARPSDFPVAPAAHLGIDRGSL